MLDLQIVFILFIIFVFFVLILQVEKKIFGLEPRKWLGIFIILLMISVLVGTFLGIISPPDYFTEDEEYLDFKRQEAMMGR